MDFLLEINKRFSALWEFKVNGTVPMEEYNEDYIFFVVFFFKREEKNRTNKNTKKDNRKYYSIK